MKQKDVSSESLEARAACLINPASGIANDYLNNFNEILLLIENLPVLLPEMIEDLEKWTPVTYREYFSKSPLPGSAKALNVYERLDPSLRDEFERLIALVTEIAKEGKEAVLSMKQSGGELDPDSIAEPCGLLAARLRDALTAASDLVNYGKEASGQCPQEAANKILAKAPEFQPVTNI